MNTDRPLVSAIVPVFNAERYVREALDSVLGQTYPALEVVVVDDGSTDRTAEIVRAYGDRVRFLQQANKGPAAARNLGLANARGRYIGFLDADDQWLPDKVERQVGLLEANPDLGACYGALVYFNEQGEIASLTHQAVPTPSGWIFEDILTHPGFIGIDTLMIRRDCLDRVGPFNEDLRTAEDTNLTLRLARHWPFGYLPGPVARYRVHSQSLTQQAGIPRGTIRSLDHLVSLYPDLRPSRNRAMRKAYALRHMDMCDLALHRGTRKDARRHGLRAVSYAPKSKRAWAYLGRALVPPAVVELFRRARRRSGGTD